MVVTMGGKRANRVVVIVVVLSNGRRVVADAAIARVAVASAVVIE